MGLDVALVHRLGAELPLHHQVGGGEAGLDVAQLVEVPVGHVAHLAGIALAQQSAGPHVGVVQVGQPLVDQRRVVAHRLQHVGDRLQDFVINLDERQGQFGLVGAVRGHRGDGMALVQGLLRGQAVVAQELGVDHRPFAQVQHPSTGLRQVGGCHHGMDAGHGFRLAGVDALDAGVGVRAPQHLSVEHPRQGQVRAVLRPPGNLVGPVVPDGPAPDYAVAVGSGGLLSGGHSSPRNVRRWHSDDSAILP